MKIVIVGPGAIGLLLAAFLSKSKEDIWLLDKNKERAEKLARDGISVEGISGKWNTKSKQQATPKKSAQQSWWFWQQNPTIQKTLSRRVN